MRFSVINLGCKVNRVEADSYEAQLAAQKGSKAVERDADVVIVNTCTVTGEAEKKTRKAVRGAIRLNPCARIIVTGCAAAITPAAFKELSDRVEVVPKGLMDRCIADISCESPASVSILGDRVRVGVKVQDGCDNACTYCIVHVARGPATSVAPESIAQRCRHLADAGVPEIVLSGINLGSYRFDDGRRLWNLADLLEFLLVNIGDSGLPRLRLSSIEPDDVDDALIGLLAERGGAVCRHLHLPLQSGSSRVLRQMARPYDAQTYADLVRRIRGALPQVSLTTDVIAGFPGETEADHEATMELCRACGFSKMHVFPYSPRVGTPAAGRADQVSIEVRRSRASQLRKLSEQLRRADLASRAGTVEVAVVERPGRACTESYHEVAVDPSVPAGTALAYRFAVQ